jgi:superfamily II DNA or RNA helicase
MSIELDEKLLGTAAGWDVMKLARAYVAQGQVVSSHWAPPLLRGVVQAGDATIRASMVIKNSIDVENLCTCRDARQWGKICAHGVAVGLHWINSQKLEAAATAAAAATKTTSAPMAKKSPSLLRADDGEPVELFFILPPNFDQAVLRGRLMLVIEAKWSGGRCPLNALPRGRTYAFSEQDNAVLDALEKLAGGEAPAVLQLEITDFAALLPALAGHSNITLGKSTEVNVTRKPFALPLRAALESNGEITVAMKEKSSALAMVGDWVWRDSTLQPFALSASLKDVLRGPVRIPRSRVPAFLSQEWPQWSAVESVEANFKLDNFTLEPQAPRFLLELQGGLAQLNARLQCAYGSRIMTLGVTDDSENTWMPDPQVPTRYSTRDPGAERTALARLERQGFSAPDSEGKMRLLGQNAVLNFFAREFPKLQREWELTLHEQLENRTLRNIERVEPQFQITPSSVQWFDLGVVFATSSGETFSAAEIQRLILSGQSHTRTKSGKTVVIDTGAVEELQEVLLDVAPQQHAQCYRIDNRQAGFLEATLRQHAGWKVQAPAAWRDRAVKQSGEARLECPPLGNLETVLRPYQKQGVAWFHFLRENGFAGILADEMGLGKTLQTLAFLNSLRSCPAGATQAVSSPSPIPVPIPSGLEERAGERRLPHLIICPTSLVFNWVAEAKKFTPELKVLALQGPDRHAAFAQINQSDLVVTSYALARRDAERYRELEFDTVVLDEAQHIKNRQTQNAQAVKAVKSKRRLVLTGTPMENSVLDLWSIFDFLMPGYLGSAKDFRERYELPIVKAKDGAAQQRLARRLRPFLLRRLKKDVAADLPARIEQVSYSELTPEQRGIYQQVIEASRKEVLEAVGTQGLAKSRMVLLTALLRLRQVCCDLRLLNLEKVDPTTASGKLEMFGELLEECIDGGHRVLVFSQFVQMLALLKESLTADGIEYCYLDGSTVNRAAVVERFQKDSDIPVFLISLKAGGVGLNLTGADTVIHFDPWWNPAVEDQATDRAHRIGQTRVVTSYKLITRETVEEKILQLQNRKREILQSTISGEEEFAAALNWDEIQELLG